MPEFTRLLEEEIIPLLRKQKGFQDEISFLAPERNEAVAISFWDKQDNAEAYNHAAYLDVLRLPVRSSCRDAHHGYVRSRYFDLPSNHGEHRLTLKKVNVRNAEAITTQGEAFMATETFKEKRQKEMARREKKQKKAARLMERRNEKAKTGTMPEEEAQNTTELR